MKWVFALNSTAPEFQLQGDNYQLLAKVAVLSAKKNAQDLTPTMIYNGQPDKFSDEMLEMGVKVIFHRLSFQEVIDAAAQRSYTWKQTAKGAFLRLDIPEILDSDENILYTDCDVMFQRDLGMYALHTNLFAVAPEFSLGDYLNINTGAMVINLAAARSSFDELKKWVINCIDEVADFDQGAIKSFYRGAWDRLSPIMNWKPYWGTNSDAVIVHFHGPKPIDFNLVTLKPNFETGVYANLYQANRASYRFYLSRWLQIYHEHLLAQS